MLVKTRLIQKKKDSLQPGLITTRQTYNNVIDLNYRLWFLSNEAGNALFYILLDESNAGCTVAFTEESIGLRYVNSDFVKMGLLKSFGPRVVLSNMSLFYIQKILNPANATFLNTVAVNPNNKDNFFVPLQLSYFKGMYDNINDEKIIVDSHKQSSVFLAYEPEDSAYNVINRSSHEADTFGLFGMDPDEDEDEDDGINNF